MHWFAKIKKNLANPVNFIFILWLCSTVCYAFGATAQAKTNSTDSHLIASFNKHITDFVKNSVAKLRYTVYRFGGTHFDANKGVYVLDCSSYVDHVLKLVCPRAFHSLVHATGSGKPTSRSYYDFFSNLPSANKQRFWKPVEDATQLLPGDILVFRFRNQKGYETGGHVMIVMNKPVPKKGAFLVKVADSAIARHSQDTRHIAKSGVGIGTLSLKLNQKTGEPYAYAWQIGSPWKKNVIIAMGRPVEKRQFG